MFEESKDVLCVRESNIPGLELGKKYLISKVEEDVFRVYYWVDEATLPNEKSYQYNEVPGSQMSLAVARELFREIRK